MLLQWLQALQGFYYPLKRKLALVDINPVSVTPSQFDLLQKSLDALTLRHKVTSQNIANLNTPGYRAKEVQFEEQLERQLQTDSQDLTRLSPSIEENLNLVTRFDGNNVDIDLEVSAMEKNAMRHRTYTQLLSAKLSIMRSAITGR